MPVIVIPEPTTTVSLNVETPVTFKSSSSVCPSTSKFLFASIFALNVAIPLTVRSPTVVTPDCTWMPSPNVAIPTKVDIPVTFKLIISKSPCSVLILPINSFA